MNEDSFQIDPLLLEALRAAAEYARYLGNHSVDTEHILLGFLRTGNQVFHGASNTDLRERVLEKIHRGTPIEPSRELPYAAAAVNALGLPKVSGGKIPSFRPATSRDVLAAILNEPNSLAGGVLRSAGIVSSEQINLR